MLGDPKIDPHGDPIPAKDGTVAASSRFTLFDVPAGITVCIQRVRDEDPALLRAVAELGLLPRTHVTVNARNTDATLSITATGNNGSTTHSVAREIAQNIFVAQA